MRECSLLQVLQISQTNREPDKHPRPLILFASPNRQTIFRWLGCPFCEDQEGLDGTDLCGPGVDQLGYEGLHVPGAGFVNFSTSGIVFGDDG